MARDLLTLKAGFRVTGEIKWRYFAPEQPRAKPHSLSHLSPEQKEDFRTQLYALIERYRSIKLICVVTDVERAYELRYINSPDDLYWYSYKQLTERFQYYLQDLERAIHQNVYGMVICDHRAPKDDERLRNLHYKLMTTRRESTSSYANFVEGLFIAPSHLSVGIQFADMIAGAVYRHYKANDPRFLNQIRGSFRTSPSGAVEGYGIVRFPSRSRG